MTKEKTFDTYSKEDAVFVMQIKIRVVERRPIDLKTSAFYFLTAKFIEMCIATFGNKIRIDIPAGHLRGAGSNPTDLVVTDIEILGLKEQDDVLRLFH